MVTIPNKCPICGAKLIFKSETLKSFSDKEAWEKYIMFWCNLSMRHSGADGTDWYVVHSCNNATDMLLNSNK